jgi:hypothetical protein
MTEVKLSQKEDPNDECLTEVIINGSIFTLSLTEVLELRNKIERYASWCLGLESDINKVGRIIKRLPIEIIKDKRKMHLQINKVWDGMYECKYVANNGDFAYLFTSITLKEALLKLEKHLNIID